MMETGTHLTATSLRRRTLVGASLFLLSCLGGCVTVDGTLKADGSGRLEMTYQLEPKTTEEAEKKRFSSAHVKVESLVLLDDKTGKAVVTFDDVTKLSTAEQFKAVEITRTHEGADERLSIKITNPKPVITKADGRPGPKFTITLPGTVREANHSAKVEESRVIWTFTLAEWVKPPVTELSVRYSPTAKARDTK